MSQCPVHHCQLECIFRVLSNEMAVRYFDENFEERQAVFVSERVEATSPGTKIINAPTGAMLVTVEVCRMCGDAKRLEAGLYGQALKAVAIATLRK